MLEPVLTADKVDKTNTIRRAHVVFCYHMERHPSRHYKTVDPVSGCCEWAGLSSEGGYGDLPNFTRLSVR